METELREIIGVLGDDPPEQWNGWRIAAIGGGANNRLYRITGAAGDYAVKLTIRDARDRAGREYHALRVLASAGANIAPNPVMLDRRHYSQPVVVSTWIEGQVSPDPPVSDTEWRCLIEHFAAIHRIKPAHTAIRLRRAWLTATSRATCRQMIDQEAARVSLSDQPSGLRRLKDRWDALNIPAWKRAPLALCRVDPNILNLIRGADRWRSVDWENSGWGDPAFEIADLITHPAYMTVEPERWEWVISEYAPLMPDPTLEARIRAYRITLLVWWCFRFNRYLYEIPRGQDQRLVPPREGWQASGIAKLEHYIGLAEQFLMDMVR